MKKFAAVLAALLVLSCGTTVLAAPSQTAAGLAKDVKATAVTADGKAVAVTVEAVENESIVKEALAKAEEKSAKSEVLALVEVEVPAGTTGKVTVTFEVPGVTAADAGKLYLLHEKADGVWEVIHPDKVEAGKVTATFSSFSPVAIVKVADTATTLPKTGAPVVLPVVALICAAGAVGCAKKVKFN